MHSSKNSVPAVSPRFPIGVLYCTPAINTFIREGYIDPLFYVCRHAYGDWGDLCSEDVQSNESALVHGNRILSSYQVTPILKIWIITEADRSVTTILLPEEY